MVKDLVEHIRSADEEERRLTIAKIPSLILQYYEQKSDIVKQILLVIHNLSTDFELYENVTSSNRATIIRHLLRLYSDKIKGGHTAEQIDALAKLVHHVSTSEVLIELTNVLYQCELSQQDCGTIDEALDSIREKAAANLYPDALLMIHSIVAINSTAYSIICDAIC